MIVRAIDFSFSPRPLTAALSLLIFISSATALGASDVRISVSLANGDRISGRIRSLDSKRIAIETGYAGLIRISVEQITGWEASDQAIEQRLIRALKGKEGRGPETAVLAQAVRPDSQSSNKLERSPRRWDGNISFGFGLSRGNTDTSDLDFGLRAIGKKQQHQNSLFSTIRHGIRDGDIVRNEIIAGSRYDVFLKGDLPAFFEFTAEFDEVEKVDLRLNYNFGLGFNLVNNDARQLAMDFGVGATHELFATQVRKNTSTAVLRQTFKQRLFRSSNLQQQFSFFPTLSEMRRYRFQADAEFKTPLNQFLSLRIGIIDRFDSRPQPRVRRNDFGVTTGIAFEF